MKQFLLDTNVVSELRKPKPHGSVVAWLNQLRDDQVFLSAVTLGELQAGIERMRAQDAKKAQEIESWVDQLADSVQVLPMDALCFRERARLMSGKPDALIRDAMIAATARVHGLTVATRNERDFKVFGVALLNLARRGPRSRR
jgi:predicted nucleic acid-binding protein